MFKALNNSEGIAEGQSSSSYSSPPEAIQLHTNRIIDFLHGTTVQLQNSTAIKSSGSEDNNNKSTANGGGNQQSRNYSALSYQAVQTQQDDTLISNNKNTTTPFSSEHLRPDLGIWDCRINNNNEMASAMLLKRVVMDKSISSSSDNNLSGGNDNGENSVDENEYKSSSPPPIVMAVDISNPNEVQTIIEQMRSVVLTIYDDNDNSKKKNSTTAAIPNKSCTTTIKALQKCTFGSTKIQEEVTVKGSSTSNEERIALILAVIIPNSSTVSSKSTSAADEYKERQARALLLYHLHKFSLEVNCTLCFVSDKKGSTSGGDGGEEKKANVVGDTDVLLGRSTTMSIAELGEVIRRVAMGLSPVEEDNDVIDQPMIEEEKGETAGEGKEDEEAASSSQRPPSIHVPGSHDGELIHGAYLRNASCEGQWDASKDDLNVALPPQSSTNVKADETKENSTGSSTSGGDEEWLSQLASSIGLSPESAASALSPKQRSKSPKHSLTPERKKKERPAVKKRVTRGTARNKEGGAKTPKDEKEVLNFFDNLLKSPKGVTPKQKKDEK